MTSNYRGVAAFLRSTLSRDLAATVSFTTPVLFQGRHVVSFNGSLTLSIFQCFFLLPYFFCTTPKVLHFCTNYNCLFIIFSYNGFCSAESVCDQICHNTSKNEKTPNLIQMMFTVFEFFSGDPNFSFKMAAKNS